MIKAKLSNGLNLIYEKNEAVDVVSIQYWVYCGSAYEKVDEYGLSHFIEHLVFKGSKHYTEEEITGTLEFLGGELNAFTSKEQTCYYVTLPKDNFGKGFKVLSDMVFNPLFKEEAIESERGVVIEEINRSEDNPYSVLGRVFNETTFQNHNYAHPILGTKDIIRNVSREKIVEYYSKHYACDRMLLVVVGNIDIDTLKRAINDELNLDFTDNTISKGEDGIPEYKDNTKTRYAYHNMPINNVLISFGYKIPSVAHKDIPALDILASVLGEGDSARLFKELRLIKPIVNGIAVSSYTPKRAGIFNFTLSLNATENTKERLSTAFREIKGILLNLSKTLSDDEIIKAKTIFISEKAYEMETANGYARKLGLMFHLQDDMKFEENYFQELDLVDKNAVLNVLNKYILEATVSSFVAIAPSNSISLEELKILFNDNFVNSTFELEFKPESGTVSVSTPLLENPKYIISKDAKLIEYKGAKLILRKINSTPLIALRVAFEGGSRFENEDTQGLGSLLARTIFMGNKKYSTEELLELVDKTASTLSANSAKNSFIINGIFLKDYKDIVLDILQHSILSPKFENPYFDTEKQMIIEAIKAREDNLPSFTRYLLQQLLYTKHPYRFSTLGTEKTINTFTQNEVKQHMSKIINRNKMILSVVGDIDEETFINYFKSLVDKMQNSSFSVEIANEPEQNKARYKGYIKDTQQTNILIAFKTVPVNSKETPVLDVLSAILSGQSGRLFINLREKYSLAYVVSPIALSGFEDGYFGIYTACDDAKTKLAVEKIREEFKKLRELPVGEEELERAKNYILGHKAIDEQRYSSQALRFTLDELFGLGYNSKEQQLEEIQKVSKEDIMVLAQKYFTEERENLVIVSKTDYKDIF